jgi:hypothetical protein
MTQPPPNAGWYPDPSGKGQRYWDGSNWGPAAPTDTPTSAPAKKKRRWPWIAAVVVVLLIIIGSVGSKNEKTSSTTAGSGSAVAVAPSTAAGIGQEVRDGKFAFIVTSVDSSDVAGDLSNEFERVQAQGRFVNVHLTVANTGDRSQTFSAADQKLTVGGKQFSPNNEAAVWTHSLNVDINPGNSIPAVVSFDVPTGSATEGGTLELHDSGLSGGVTVTLPKQPGA